MLLNGAAGLYETIPLLYDYDLKNLVAVWWNRIKFTFIASVWISEHWQFTAYYMQTACLLRMTLRARTQREILLVEDRKIKLQILEYGA